MVEVHMGGGVFNIALYGGLGCGRHIIGDPIVSLLESPHSIFLRHALEAYLNISTALHTESCVSESR